MYVSLNKKQKIAIVVIIITMSIIAVLLSKLINHVEPKTVTEDSIPKSTEHKEIPEAEESQKSFSDYVESYISSNAKKKEIELEVREPIQEIKSESDIFETWKRFDNGGTRSFTVRIDDSNKTIWGISNGGKLDSYSEEIVRHDDEGFNIKGINEVLKEKGINIEDCDIKFITNGLCFDNDDTVFKIYYNNNEPLFLLKENQLINLSDYGISFYHNGVYSVKENKTNYISFFNQKNNTIEYYIIPFELKSIERAYFSNYNPNEFFVVAKKIGEENLSYFKINIVYRSIVEFETIKYLTDFFSLKFSFKSDVIYNRIVEEIGDVYIIKGTDDGISGHHYHDYLYGANKHTGQKVWSFYGDYLGTPYSITKDEKYIIILNREKLYAECLEIQTGKVMWEDSISNENDAYLRVHSFNEFGKVFIVEYNKKLVAINKENLKKMWTIEVPKNSDSILIYKISEDKRHVYYFDENDLKVKCIEVNNGNIIWEKSIDSSFHFEAPFNDYFASNELFIIFSEKRIIAFNTTDGSIAWESKLVEESGFQYRINSVDPINVSIHNDLFILIYRNGLIAIDNEDGQILWNRLISEAEDSYNFYNTLFNGKEILVLFKSDDIYVIEAETGDIINEFHEEEIADHVYKVELEDNILYLYSRILNYEDKSINLETGEINNIPDSNEQETIDNIKEALTGKILYDGIGISYKFNSTDYNYIEAKDENGNVKWAYNYNGFSSFFFDYYHSPKRIKNKIYISNNSAIVCVDALTGKNLYQLGEYEDLNSEIVKLSDGIYWSLGNDEYIDVYKID